MADRDRLVSTAGPSCPNCGRPFKDRRGFSDHVRKCERGETPKSPQVPGGRPRNPSRCVLYVIETTEGIHRCKIGISWETDLRFAAIQAMSPVALRIRSEWLATNADEWDMHQEFAADRLHGEWFEGSVAERAEASLAARGLRRIR